MKKILTATALGALLTGGVAIAMQAQPAAAPKTPQTKAQMLARADARFDRLDTNKDGQLSAEERKAGMERARAGRAERRGGEMADFEARAGRRGGGGGISEKMLARIDTNGDGLISRAENRAAAEARFARMDADKDGMVEAGEYGKRGKAEMRRGPDGERMSARGEHRGAGGKDPRGMIAADSNGDGVVTRAKFDAASAQRFARMDANSDGKLDAADRPQRRMAPTATPEAD